MIIHEGTTHPGHRRIVLLTIAAAALIAALVVTMQGKALQGAVIGYETTNRVSEIQQYQSGCNECLDAYIACMSPVRKRRDYSDERLANINHQCATKYKNCRNRVQCFN
jgi:hypothetical protein